MRRNFPAVLEPDVGQVPFLAFDQTCGDQGTGKLHAGSYTDKKTKGEAGCKTPPPRCL